MRNEKNLYLVAALCVILIVCFVSCQGTDVTDSGTASEQISTAEETKEPEGTAEAGETVAAAETSATEVTTVVAGTTAETKAETTNASETKATETTKSAETTKVPETTKKQENTKAPETTKSPETTKVPETSKAPDTTHVPETTKTPETTKSPETTKTPETTKSPETTKTPETTRTPETTSAPEVTTEPEITTPAATEHVCSYTKKVVKADCLKSGYTLYSCSCGKSYKDDFTAATGHRFNSRTEKEAVSVSAARCVYKVTYEGICEYCKTTVSVTENEERHEWTVEITSAATCVASGIRSTVCANTVCEYNKKAMATAEYTDKTAHKWSYSGLVGLNRSYTCDYCKEYKAVVDYSGKTAATVDKATVKSSTEIVLKEASLSLSEDLKNALPENVTLSAGKADASEIASITSSMKEEDKKKLGDAPVYNFSLTSGGKDVDFAGGSITISLPYTLKKGDNPDNVVVWYLADNGSVSDVAASYSNGRVVFTLSHFSCYAVLELSGEEYCAEYGHAELTVVNPTCTEGGRSVCSRCNEIIETTEAWGHKWNSTVVSELTETTNGVVRFTCENCNETYDNITPAPGHVHALTPVSAVSAGCLTEGRLGYYSCSCGMNFSDAEGAQIIENLSTLTVPAAGHTIEAIEAKASTCIEKGHTAGGRCTVCGELLFGNEELDYGEHIYEITAVENPTCTESGYTTHVCHVCGDKYNDSITAALGHRYSGTVTEPTCLEGGYTSYVCTVCSDTYVGDNVPARGHSYIDTVIPATCTVQGYTLHVCMYGDYSFHDSYTGPKGHTYEETVTPPTCTLQGYTTFVCVYGDDTYVGNYVNAKGHTYGDTVKAPTCTEQGYTTHACIYDDDSYVDTYVKPLGHTEATRTEAAATCTSAGISVTYCSKCSAVLGSSAIQTLPHKAGTAEIEFLVDSDCVRTGSYDEVVYCSVCRTEMSRIPHTVSLKNHTPSSAIVENFVDSDCVTAGTYDFVVYCADCGAELSRTEHTVSLKQHTPSSAIVENFIDSDCVTAGHYDSVVYCAVCHGELSREEMSVAAKNHTPSSAIEENRVDSDCVTAGHYDSVVYCAVCRGELSRTNVALPLAEHKYVDGICTVCAGCNHVTGPEKVVFLDEDNDLCLGSGLLIKSCKCGQKVERVFTDTNWNSISSNCLFAIRRNNTVLDNYDYCAECIECGLKLEVFGTVESSANCNYIPHLTTRITLSGAVLIEAESVERVLNACEFEVVDHDFPIWKEKAHCLTCKNCGRLSDVYENFIKYRIRDNEETIIEGGELSYENDSSYVDDFGNTHTVKDKYDGYYRVHWIDDVCEEQLSACSKKITGTVTVVLQTGTETFSYERIEHDDSFVRFVKHGNWDFCTDGFAGYYLCTCCGECRIISGNAHVFELVGIDTPCSEWDEYTSEITYRHCTVCNMNCNLVLDGRCTYSSQYYNYVNGYYFRTCTKCGFEVRKNRVYYNQDYLVRCKSVESNVYTFILPDGDVKHSQITDVTYGHDFGDCYDTYEIVGSSCMDGVLKTSTCVYCGYVKKEITYGHGYEKITIMSPHPYGCKAGMSYLKCRYCEDTTMPDRSEFYSHRSVSSYGANPDIGFSGLKCYECDLEIWNKTEYLREGCQTTLRNTIKVVYKNQVLFEKTADDGTMQSHIFDYSVVHSSQNCEEDEWYNLWTCTICGYTYIPHSGTGHVYERKKIAAHDLNLDYAAYASYCMTCGARGYDYWNDWSSYDYSKNEILSDGSVKMYTINGFNYKITSSAYVYDGCTCYETLSVTTGGINYLNEDYVIHSLTLRLEPRANHDYVVTYRPLSHTCYAGVEISETCTRCGDVQITYAWGHRKNETSGYTTDFGMCKGWYRLSRCIYCGLDYSYFDTYGCSFGFVETDNLGRAKYLCSVCGAEKYVWDTTETDGCYEYNTRHLIYKMNGTELYSSSERYDSVDHHEFPECTYTFFGDGCEDGWKYSTVCAVCGEEWIYDEGNAHSFTIDVGESVEVSSCGLYIRGKRCSVCGEMDETKTEFFTGCQPCYVDKYLDENGDIVSVCSECGLVIRENYLTGEKESNCMYINKIEKYLWLGTELLAKTVESEMRFDHSWVYDCSEAQFDFSLHTTYCADCGVTVKVIDGYPCGTWTDKYIHFDGICPIRVESYCDLVDGTEARFYGCLGDMGNYEEIDGFEISTCAICGVKQYFKMVDTELENGIWRQEITYIFKKDEVELLRWYHSVVGSDPEI